MKNELPVFTPFPVPNLNITERGRPIVDRGPGYDPELRTRDRRPVTVVRSNAAGSYVSISDAISSRTIVSQ